MTDERMDALASRQHGLITHRQALSLGFTESAIRHRRRSGRLSDVRRQVYRLPGAIQSPRLRALAAVVAAGDGAVLSHRSAAALHGIPGFAIEPLTVSIPRRRRSLAGVQLEQSLVLPPHHRLVLDAIPCTSVARTLFDLCGAVRAPRAERAFDSALARRLVTLPALWRVLDELAEHGRGHRTAAHAVDRAGRALCPARK